MSYPGYGVLYPRFTKIIIDDLMKKCPSNPKLLEENYHSIKDDIPLVSVYTTWNVTVQRMLIPDEFLTEEIRATNDYKEYEMVFVGVDKRKKIARETSSPQKSRRVTIKKKAKTTSIPPPSDDRERDEIAEATLLSLTIHKTALAAKAQENIAKVQEKLEEEDIEKLVEEPGSHKENPEFVEDNDNVNVIEKEDDGKKDDIGEKTDDAKEKDNDDHNDHSMIKPQATGSKEIRTEKMQTPIPTPTRSPRKGLSSDKIIFEELTASVSPTTATTSKQKSKSKTKKGFNKTRILPGSIDGMCMRRGQIRTHIKQKFITHEFFMGKIREVLDHCNNVVPELTFAKTNELIKKEIPRLNTTLNLYPTSHTPSSSTATISTADLQYQLYLNMKLKPQDRAADLEIWEILKTKFEKP
ncbi:hypothetical protein Tco_0557090 [Tanacetum coccineum]